MERKNGRTRGTKSKAFGGIKGDSDSCDSAAHRENSGGNSAWDSNDKENKKLKLKKKPRSSFSKGLMDLMNLGENSATTASAAALPSSSPKHYRTVSTRARTDWGIYDSNRREAYDILEDGEPDEPIPKLPKGKKMVDTLVGTDVDSLFKSVFENDTFFEIVGAKAYEEFRNYKCSEWLKNRSSGLMERHMKYELSKTIAFSRQNVFVEQTQIRLGYSRKGSVYGVDTVTQNTGVVYSDYFRLNIHYRFLQAEDKMHSHLIVVADIEFLKPCLFKGRIESEAWSGLKKYYDVVGNEVLPEKDLTEEDVDGVHVSKLMKDSYNRRLLYDREDPEAQNRQTFSQEVVMAAFLMVILVLVMLTMALFKMNATITHLDERLQKMEDILERNGRFFEIVMGEEFNKKS